MTVTCLSVYAGWDGRENEEGLYERRGLVGKVEVIREGVRPQAEPRRCRHAKRAGVSSGITI